jgi:hypothetical protein
MTEWRVQHVAIGVRKVMDVSAAWTLGSGQEPHVCAVEQTARLVQGQQVRFTTSLKEPSTGTQDARRQYGTLEPRTLFTAKCFTPTDHRCTSELMPIGQ